MLVMGLDTALQRCSVAILRHGEAVGDQSEDMARGHAEYLAPMAAAALAEAAVKVADLDRIGVVVGPGGFTGVRVGLSFARGLAIGTDIPVIGVTSLAALAANHEDAPEGALVAPVIDARRSQVYGALYEKPGRPLLAPFVANPEQALDLLTQKASNRHVVAIGSGAGLLSQMPAGWRRSEASDQIDAKIVARLASHAPVPDGPPAPLYLRAPDAKPPKPGLFDGRTAKP